QSETVPHLGAEDGVHQIASSREMAIQRRSAHLRTARDRRRRHIEAVGDEELSRRGEQPSVVANGIPPRRMRHCSHSHPRGSPNLSSHFIVKRAILPTFSRSVRDGTYNSSIARSSRWQTRLRT